MLSVMPHVIIADDNREFLELLATYCSRAGWTVETCRDGAELMHVVAAGSEPGLLLIDVMMPVVDGIEAIERICDYPRPLRVRFMSGGDSANLIAAKLIAMARDMSVGRNIFKPIERAEFLSILAEEEEHLLRFGSKAGVGS
ncbi:response regulator [Phaeobacter sp. B1627]|uniref:response regulator n=1 Tax=Phaeobacter sp. B1627 TaxID=2583809 RepID=UPI00111A3604|nr:response regulator [Phaeobacter sp. B1627]TNJ39742.1 response regulator [Phaeobacter sp. B1627]